MDTAVETRFPVIIDQSAREKAAQLLARQGRDDLRLRIQVQPGGCSGLIQGIAWSNEDYDGDVILDCGDFEAVVDRMSVPYLDGALLSYEDTLEKSGFTIDNPNAEGTCACGGSFH